MRICAPLLTISTIGLALLAPAAANAAEGFVGVTDANRLVTFSSDTVPALSAPRVISGLGPGERIVAMDASSAGDVLALSSTGAVYAVDAKASTAQKRFDTPAGPVTAGAPATLSISPDGLTVRILGGDHDITLDMSSGTVLRKEQLPVYAVGDAGAGPAPVAVDYGADGVLRGVDPARESRVRLDATGIHTEGHLDEIELTGPTSLTTTSDGTQWIVTRVATRSTKSPVQSRILRYNAATGQVAKGGSYLSRGLDAIAAVGHVRDDTAAPKVSVTIPKQSVRKALKNRGVFVYVKTSEGGQTIMSVRQGGKTRAFGLGHAEHAGRVKVHAFASQAAIRRMAGKRMRLHITVHDNAGHKTVLDRYLRLSR